MLIDRQHMVPGTLWRTHTRAQAMQTHTHTRNDRKVGSGTALIGIPWWFSFLAVSLYLEGSAQ